MCLLYYIIKAYISNLKFLFHFGGKKSDVYNDKGKIRKPFQEKDIVNS